jgi:hypothetical protein
VLPAGNALRSRRHDARAIVAPLFSAAGRCARGRRRHAHPQPGAAPGRRRLTRSRARRSPRTTRARTGARSPGAGELRRRLAADARRVEEYEDVSSYRAGVEHRFGDGPLGGLLAGVAGRVGFSFAESAAPAQAVTPLLPDMDRYNFSVGAGIPIGSRFTLDARTCASRPRTARTVERPDGATAEEASSSTTAGSRSPATSSVGLRARF